MGQTSRSVLRTVAAFAAWALVHSLLATHRSKRMASNLLGEAKRNGLYRISYNAVAVVSAIVLAVYVHRLPDRDLYRLPPAVRVFTGASRVALLLFLAAAAAELGIGPFSGFSELRAYLRGLPSFEPEAQGPSMGESGLRTSGPFAVVRHPLNSAATALVLLTPRMTAVRLTVASITLLYSLAGSRLEERRLVATYGEPYLRYLHSGVPFFVPRLRSMIF